MSDLDETERVALARKLSDAYVRIRELEAALETEKRKRQTTEVEYLRATGEAAGLWSALAQIRDFASNMIESGEGEIDVSDPRHIKLIADAVLGGR